VKREIPYFVTVIENNVWPLIEHENGTISIKVYFFERSWQFGQVDEQLRVVATKLLSHEERIDKLGLAADYLLIKPSRSIISAF
jgi:hypothetical protein